MLTYLMRGYLDTFFVVPLWFGFLSTALVLCASSWRGRMIGWCATGCVMGIAQSFALLIPGLSRLAITYCAAHWAGQRGAAALILSFAAIWPLMGVASLRAFFSLAHRGQLGQFFDSTTVGIVVVASCGAGAVLWLTYYLARRERMWWYAPYVFVMAGIAWLTRS
jgi:undecaprenyl pyrophosphate phosphatase UppP